MKAVSITFAVFLLILAQSLGAGAAPAALTAAERTQLDRETNLDRRVRIYEAASQRLLRQVQGEFKSEEYERVAATLEAWQEVILASRKEVEAKANPKRKSRAVIQYEIQLRKAISEVRDLALRAPTELEDPFRTWLEKAEEARKSMVDVLFDRS